VQQHYLVMWPIDIWADTPKEAAQHALEIQRDLKSIATLFDVKDGAGKWTQIDLREDPEKELRALWTKNCVPQATQDEIIREIGKKAKPGAIAGPFKI